VLRTERDNDDGDLVFNFNVNLALFSRRRRPRPYVEYGTASLLLAPPALFDGGASCNRLSSPAACSIYYTFFFST